MAGIIESLRNSGHIVNGVGTEKSRPDYGGPSYAESRSTVSAAPSNERPNYGGPSYANGKIVSQPAQTPSRTPTTIRQYGTNAEVPGYIENGKTYYNSGARLSTGDMVTVNGQDYIYDGGKGKGVSRSEWESTYGPRESRVAEAYVENKKGYDQNQQMINDLVARNEAYQRQMIDLATQKAINEKQAAYDNAVNTYNQLAAQNAIMSAQEADNLALRNAAAGDKGGIGQKLYSDQMAAYDNRAMSIKLEQVNLKNSIDREVADLRLQGEYEKADVLAQLANMQVNALQNEYDQYIGNVVTLAQLMEGQKTAAQDTAYDRAANKLQLGFSITPEDAATLGVDQSEAQAFADRINLLAQLDLASAQAQLAGLTSRGSGGGGGGGGGGVNYSKLFPSSLDAGEQALALSELASDISKRTGITNPQDALSDNGRQLYFNLYEKGYTNDEADAIVQSEYNAGRITSQDAATLGYLFNPEGDAYYKRPVSDLGPIADNLYTALYGTPYRYSKEDPYGLNIYGA